MKSTRRMLLAAGFLASLSFVGAQQAVDIAQPDTASQVYLPAMNPSRPVPPIAWAFNGIKVNDVSLNITSVADLQTMLEALQGEPPTPLASLPKNRFGQVVAGGFWSLQNPDWPPLPGDVLGLDAWPLGNGSFIMDDRNVDYAALDAEAKLEAAATLQLGGAPMMRMSMMTSSLSTAYAYGNPVYLTNMAASFASDGSMTANFSIGGGTNFVPYDILMATNLLTPVSQWNWLGIGYTSNNYTFYEQPANLGFYILAKPSKKMTAGIGNDDVGQCDVPYALTNALQVAGGGGQSLALKTDGTVVAWGANYYGEGVVPTNLTGVAMVSAGWYHSVALLTNGTVTAWGLDIPILGYTMTQVPSNLTNAVVISAQALHTLALRTNGTVVAWGYNTSFGETNVPAGLTNVTAISAGYQFNLVVSNGYVVAWGDNTAGQCNVPAGLSNVVDVAAGTYHSLALLQNGTVAAWGDNLAGETDVPAGLSNVVAIAAGGDPDIDTAYSMALKNDGTLVVWGDDDATEPFQGLNNIIGIAAGADHALAVRTGPATPVITLQPADEYQVQGSNAVFTARGAGLYGVTYQWQTNGVNVSGANGAALTLTNVQPPAQLASYRVVVGNEVGSLVSSNASFYFVTPPVILSQTLPTNQVGIYNSNLTLTVVATAPGITSGFPLSYQWQFNGTNISEANSASYTFHVSAYSFGTYSVQVSNAAGSTNATWLVSVSYPSGLLITQQPTNQFQIAGGTINFYGAGVSSNAVSYQWQFNGTNIAGATNTTLTITNVQAAQQGYYNFVLSNGAGGLASSNASFTLVTIPTILSNTMPTNLVFGVPATTNLVLNIAAMAPGLTNGFPLSYLWQSNGVAIAGATVPSNSFTAIAPFSAIYSVTVSNAAGSTNVAWQITVTNAINVTNDLLLIYNTNSPDSTTVFNYYLAHRPMVSGANVLGINCTSNETILPSDFTNSFIPQIQSWLAANPTKQPQYVILFNQMPSRVNTNATPGFDNTFDTRPSVQYQIHSGVCSPNWNPYVTSINMNGYGGISNCIGYINKLAFISTNYSPGQLVISASAGGYGNTNYVLDDVHEPGAFNSYVGATTVSAATNGLFSAGVSSVSISFLTGIESNSILPHLTNAMNVAGYISWGSHSSLGGQYATNGVVKWTGSSGWWLIETVESFNGEWTPGQGNFVLWFSSNAFGGANYSNTPVGAVSHTDEPGLGGVSNSSIYFGSWASGKNFAICAWSPNSINTTHFQAVGDPFVTR